MKKDKTNIGIEVHIQLNTKSKLFCGCSTSYSRENTSVCETCLGHPGCKPRLNKEAVNKSLKISLALNCKIQDRVAFLIWLRTFRLHSMSILWPRKDF
jgi:aspartyl-tRNA(Asn)/glutamyl-tRNA(Gln) amidotransferase subunit B